MKEILTNQTKIQQTANEFVKKWGEDSNTTNFSRKLGLFVSQLNDDTDVGETLIDLVNHFNYYSRENINKILLKFYDMITDELKLAKATTIYSRLEDDSKIDSSSTLLEEFKIINGISNTYSHNIEHLNIEDFDSIENIIFIDDIIGSGRTVKTFFEVNKSKLMNANIFLFCIVILDEAFVMLNNYFNEQGFKCKIIANSKQFAAFKKDYIFFEDCNEKESLLRDFETNLFGKKSKNILGFENSQALVSFFRNTPNNTLGTFWYKGEKWIGLFPRNLDKPLFMKNRARKKGNNPIGYNLSKLENQASE